MSHIEVAPEDSIQARSLRIFTALHQLRNDWGGALILSCGLDRQGTALAFASNISGAVCLSLEADPAIAHQALRTGACDFVVNTLDEALRAIKNELRKHRPLSVGLQGDPEVILREVVERGVLPELFVSPSYEEAATIFKSQGSIILDMIQNVTPEAVPQSSQWRLYTFTFSSSAAQRAFDAYALTLLSSVDALRRQWLQAAPRVLPRESPLRRVLWLTPDEKAKLAIP